MSQHDSSVLEKAQVRGEKELVQQWLASFETALRQGEPAALAANFAQDSHWRDMLAFYLAHKAPPRRARIAAAMIDAHSVTRPHNFAVAEGRTPPRRVQRAGFSVIEAILSFETAAGRGFGVLRLLADQPSRAFQLMTSLHELKGFEEQVGKRRPTGEAYSRNFGGTNWKDQRQLSQSYEDREPAVLVIGGGQGGLSVAARLGRLGVDTLIIDRHERVGDNWRKRYHSLALHNETDVNHLPYMPFPPSWPKYLPKDMLADWFEAYAWAMELNFWTGTELASGSYDEASGTWKAVLRRTDGSERVVRPRHIIFATGIVGFPRIPSMPGLEDFKGEVMHSSAFTNGAHWRGKKALVFGTGNSAHDVAQDLHCNGVATTIVQRGSTTVLSINPSAKLVYGVYDGIPLEDADLLVTTNTLPVTRTNLQKLTARMMELDKELVNGLIARGFKIDYGEDGAGHQMKIRRRSGGYYLNAGCSELIISGEVGLLQFDRIEKLVPEGALLKDGSIHPADLIVFGTGFVTQEILVGKLLGEEVARKVGPVWGIGPDGEMNNMWKRTAQEGLWFVGSGFAACRSYSRIVALQVKAIEEGLLSKKFPGPPTPIDIS